MLERVHTCLVEREYTSALPIFCPLQRAGLSHAFHPLRRCAYIHREITMNSQTDQLHLRDADSFNVKSLSRRYQTVRQQSIVLAQPLSVEDCCVQSMPDASPIKWHLAHTSWFFETFILEQFEPDFQSHHPAFRFLFNSYYNGIGDRHARAQRGLLTRPSMAEVQAYRADVDQRIVQLLAASSDADTRFLRDLQVLLELGLQHEQQHQELMMTDVLHLLSCNPLKPAYADTLFALHEPCSTLQWLHFDGGITQIGSDGETFCFDNEMPQHRQFIEPYELANRLVTNQEYLAFIDAGGYRDPAFWLSEGWDWVQTQQLTQPLYWFKVDHENEGSVLNNQRDLSKNAEDNKQHNKQDTQQLQQGWHAFSLHGMRPLDWDAAVTQLSYFEADAYARWAGARLPTEAEWEHAAWAERADLKQLFGECWQWTSSSYAAYPGYQTAAGALGEYNGKFMSNQYVLRGSSRVTAMGHSRVTYRNFFPATARWQFSGIRLAR